MGGRVGERPQNGRPAACREIVLYQQQEKRGQDEDRLDRQDLYQDLLQVDPPQQRAEQGQANEELDRPPAHCGTGFACSFVCGFICGEASAIPRRNQRWRW